MDTSAKVFKWIRWYYAQTHNSAWWAIVCTWILFFGVALWFKTLFLKTVLYTLSPGIHQVVAERELASKMPNSRPIDSAILKTQVS
jgi:hypothetical protein